MTRHNYDRGAVKPGTAGWYDPDGTFHPVDMAHEADGAYAYRVRDLGAAGLFTSLVSKLEDVSDLLGFGRMDLARIWRNLERMFVQDTALGEQLVRDLRGKLDAIRTDSDPLIELLTSIRADLAVLTKRTSMLKQDLFVSSANVVLPAGVYTNISPIVDVREWSQLGTFILNTGANPMGNVGLDWSHDAAMTQFVGAIWGVGPAAAGSVFFQRDPAVATQWQVSPVACFNYMRVGGLSALGTTAQCSIVGHR